MEKIGKVAEGVAAQDCEEFKRNLHAHDYPGHVRHTELATIIR